MVICEQLKIFEYQSQKATTVNTHSRTFKNI
uniref:Uncharacterized protein n=1 Tax=Anguilla anguilla TaxID=7936 RepID=A0A0E9UMR0_ANGAN